VYGSLLDGERRRGHGTAGRALERLYAGRTTEVVELLAYHFARSDDRGPAVDYAIQAGEKAQGRWANAEALAHFAGALDRLAGMPESDVNRRRRIDAVLKQAEAHFAQGQHEAQVQALAGIRELVESSGDARRRATWCYWTGFLTSLTGGPPERAIALCQEAVTIADGAELADVRAFAECCLAQARFIAGDLRGAMEAGERALQAFEARGDVWWACRTLWVLISAANTLGEWERSLVYCRRALDHGQSVDDLRLKVVGWWRLGWTHIRRGDVATGLSCCEEALRLGPSGYDAAMVKAAHGYGLVKAGQAAAGTAELEAAVAWFEQTHHRFSRLFYTLWLGETRLRRDDPVEAERLLAGALGEARRAGYRYLEGVAGRLLATARADRDPAGAQALARDAGFLLESVGAQDELARAWLTQAELAARAGDRAGARDLLARARATFEALGTLDGPALVEPVEATLAGPGR
jgi:tetratricopeptide (TPR) repeat protein